MRISLVAHGFPPLERTGVEQYTAALAAEFARGGHVVEVFVPRRKEELPDHSLRRESRVVPGAPGVSYGVNWVTVNRDPEGPLEMLEVPAVARVFGQFLDRERPQVCHFQHVVKLGTGLIEEARQRGIPTIYTAHDYYAVCHRYTLLRPDLSHCDTRGDSMACAHCDLALGHLNAQPGLGDYQMGVFPDQLEPEAWSRLASIHDDEAEEAGISTEEIDEAFDLRRDLDARRARAFDGLDRVIAPTRFLSNELVGGGVDPRKLEVLPYGIDVSDLAGLRTSDPVRAEGGGPLRFAFVGGLSKHKGVHLLLEAWRRLERGARPAELTIWGHGTDEVFLARIRTEAASLGVRWRGPYERPDLPRVLASADVVISPSTWVENYPIVIREAFAAGRPVIASRFGAVPESIHDGINGLLFDRNDPDDLRRVLARCVNEPGLVGSLLRGLPQVHDIEKQSAELLERYREVVEQKAVEVAEAAERDPGLPPSVGAFHARYEALSDLPTRELLERALQGLSGLRKGLGCGALGVTELFRAVGEGVRTQDWMRDARQEIDWLRKKAMEEGEIRDKLEDAVGFLERDLVSSAEGSARQVQHLRSAEEYMREKEAALVDAEERLVEAEAYIRAKESDLKAAEFQLDEASRYVASKEVEVQSVNAELDQLKAFASEKELAIERIESALADAGAYARSKEVQLSETEQRLGEAGQHIEYQQKSLEDARLELERAALHVRKQEVALSEREDALRQADGRMRAHEDAMRVSRADLEGARDALRSADEERARLRKERDRVRASAAEREGELEQRASKIEEQDALIREREQELLATAERARQGEDEAAEGAARLRSAAELALVAIDTQRRLLAQVLIPVYRDLLLMAQPGQDPELPHPNSDFAHLIGALRWLGEPLRALDEELQWRRSMDREHGRTRVHFGELQWRRQEMDKLLSLMERSALTRVLALEKNRGRILGWREEEKKQGYPVSFDHRGEESSKSELQEDGE